MIEKTLKTTSEETKAAGSISTMQAKIPKAHERLMSFEDLRRLIRMISGMFQNGNITPAINPSA